MYKEDRNLTNIILGEVVEKMLDADAPISFNALLAELELMLMAERIAERRKAILSAIQLVKANLPKPDPFTLKRVNTVMEIVFFSTYLPTNKTGE